MLILPFFWLVIQFAEQLFLFFFRQVAPLPDRQVSQVDIHDPYPLQSVNLVAKCLAHAADLPVQALGQSDVKFVF